MTVTNLEAFRISRGIKKTYEEMSQAEKVQLRYNYVMEMTKNAHGDFARTAGGTANRARTVTESFKELTSNLVQGLMPAINQILALVIQVTSWFNNLNSGTQQFILYTLLLTATLGPLVSLYAKLIQVKAIIVGLYKAASLAQMTYTAGLAKDTAATTANNVAKNTGLLTMMKTIGAYVAHTAVNIASTTAIGAMTIAQWALNAAFWANPIVWVVACIIGLVAGIILLWKKSEGFRKFFMSMWDGIVQGVKFAINGIIFFLNAYLSAYKFMINGTIFLVNQLIKGINLSLIHI
jgi:phage-related protein